MENLSLHMGKPIIIVGPSCCGKSTVARTLYFRLGYQLLSLDDYYIENADPIYVMGSDGEPHKTWERPYMYDGAKLVEDIQQDECIIEGFVALQYPEIQEINAYRIYLDLPLEECLRRRKLRPRHDASDKSWEIIGEQETKLFVESQKKLQGVVIYNANADIDLLVDQIYWEYLDKINVDKK